MFAYFFIVIIMSTHMCWASESLYSTQSDKKKISEGKTKIIWEHPEDTGLVIVESKDDITAGDGARHDIMPGKAILANTTTCNVFRLLQAAHIPIAFMKALDEKTFLAHECTMIPCEVVVRRAAYGSFVKRNPNILEGTNFPKLIVEFFLKTSNRTWHNIAIPKDDPLMEFQADKVELFLPDVPRHQQSSPFLSLCAFDSMSTRWKQQQIEEYARILFLMLEKAWQQCGIRLIDLKIEFGKTQSGKLMIADVIDNDSWRITRDGKHLDKQIYRNGGEISYVKSLYEEVAQLTNRFTIPKQQIIIWQGSESDSIAPFEQELRRMMADEEFTFFFTDNICKLLTVTQSAHKSPIACCMMLNHLIYKVADSVIIAYIGSSNAAGPLLSTQSTVPVISVPAHWKDFHEDIWSSLRTPSYVPTMTVLDPKNAMLAAEHILAMHNPLLYAYIRYKQEKQLVNVFEI